VESLQGKAYVSLFSYCFVPGEESNWSALLRYYDEVRLAFAHGQMVVSSWAIKTKTTPIMRSIRRDVHNFKEPPDHQSKMMMMDDSLIAGNDGDVTNHGLFLPLQSTS